MRIKSIPMAHQIRGFDYLRGKPYGAYWADMGTGKTLMTLMEISMAKEKSFLIVAPKGVYQNWLLELEKHMEGTPQIFVWKANKKPKAPPTEPIFLINVEALSSEAGFLTCLEWCQRQKVVFCVVDEATCIKNAGTSRWKALNSLRRYFQTVRLLTGTPVTKNPLDLYAPFAFMSPRILGFNSFYAFRARYAVLINNKGAGSKHFPLVVGYKNLEELKNKMEPWVYRITKEECLDLPPKVFQTVYVELTDEQNKHMTMLKKHAMTILDDLVVKAAQITTLIIRFQQVLAGYLPTEEGVVRIKSNRMTSLLSLLEETEGKVIIWTHFRPAIADVAASVARVYGKNSYVTYFGDTSTDDRVDNVARFQSDPECRIFIGNQQTAGMGLTLTAASTVIYFTNSYDYALRAQSEDRAHRIGQTKSVTYVDLVCPGTIDERILKVLKNKQNMAEYIADGKHKELFK